MALEKEQQFPNLYHNVPKAKPLCYIIIIFFISGYNLANAKSLNQAVKDAISNSKELKAQEYYLKSAKSTKNEAYSEFLPEVSASLQYGEKKNDSLQNSDQFEDEENQTFSISQPLFQGFGGVFKLNQGKNSYLSSLNSYEKFKHELILKTINIYLSLYKARKDLEIVGENKDLHEKILDRISMRKNLISESEQMDYEINYANSLSLLEETNSNLDQAISDYRILVGNLDDGLSLPQIEDVDLDSLKILTEKIESHPLVKEKHHAYLASKANSKIALSEFSPKANLVAQAREEKDVVYLGGDDLETKSIYVDISIPIFQKGLEYSRLSKSKNEEEAKRYEYLHAKEQILEELKKALRDYKSKKQIFESKERIFKLTEKQYQKQKTNFDYGKADSISFHQSHIKYNEAKITRLEAEIAMLISYYKLKILVGEFET